MDGSSTSKDWFEIPHNKKAWIIKVKDTKTGESVRIFEGIQTKEAVDFLREKISKFSLIVLGGLEPEHHKSIKKCIKCRFLNDCEHKITNS
jgi:hypothetical protein